MRISEFKRALLDAFLERVRERPIAEEDERARALRSVPACRIAWSFCSIRGGTWPLLREMLDTEEERRSCASESSGEPLAPGGGAGDEPFLGDPR